jgi:hypothetical protein
MTVNFKNSLFADSCLNGGINEVLKMLDLQTKSAIKSI